MKTRRVTYEAILEQLREKSHIGLVIWAAPSERLETIVDELSNPDLKYSDFMQMCMKNRVRFLQANDGLNEQLLDVMVTHNHLEPETECYAVQIENCIYFQTVDKELSW